MENEVVIHVRAEDETDRVFNQIKAKAKKTGEELERDLKQSGTKAGGALADGISAGTARVGDDVERQMSSVGGRAGKALSDGISDGLKGAGGGSEGVGDKLTDGLAKAGRKAGFAGGEAAVSGFAKVFGKLDEHPAIGAAILGIGATFGPPLAGVLGAAVIGTGGALGIAGGFAASVKDPRVKSSLQDLKKQVTTDLKAAGSDFAPASVRAVGQIKEAWVGIMPTIRSVFDKSEDLIEPFIGGILDGVSALVEGIEQSLDGAGPVMESLGDLFRNLGEDLGEVFIDLEDNAGQIADSVNFLSDTLGVLLDAMTWVIEAGATWFSQFPALGRAIEGGAEISLEWAQSLLGVKDATEEVSLKGAVWHDGITANTDAIKEQESALKSLSDEMNKQTDPLYALIEAQANVKDAQEKYNKALEKHGPKSEEARDALIKLGKAAGNVTSAAAKAADSGFDGNLTPAMRNAMKQAGLSAKEINALEGALRRARSAANRWEGTFVQTYITKYKEMGLKSPQPQFQGYASGGITGAATGGVHSNSRLVGEYGPEILDLPPGSHVYSNADSMSAGRMVPGGGTGGGSGPGAGPRGGQEVKIRFDAAHGNKFIRALMEALRAEIRNEGGSVQSVLGTI